jgi:2-polyprenyl-6-methoxyphenol hydroxylase-like FAD-dependent oxidoreductase
VTNNNTDVLIVGAGPTGLSLATSLAARGIQTTIIDREIEGAKLVPCSCGPRSEFSNLLVSVNLW